MSEQERMEEIYKQIAPDWRGIPTEKTKAEEYNLTALAIVKAHAFSQEYDPNNGSVIDRPNYHALKEGYTAGFLAGFVYKITGDKDL